MILAKFAARSKSEKPGGKRARWILLAAAGLVLLVMALGPAVLLNFIFTQVLPSEYGVAITYDHARAGFLLRSATISNLKIESPDPSRYPLTAELVSFEGLSALNLIRLARNPEAAGSGPLPLAGQMEIRGLSLGGVGGRLTVGFLEARSLIWHPAGSDLGPLVFDMLETRDLRYDSERSQNFSHLALNRLEARSLTPEYLGALKVNGLELASPAANNNALKLELGGLTLGGLRTKGLGRAVTGREGFLSALWLLSACDTLDLAGAALTRGDREALNLRNVVFDVVGPDESGVAVYTRRLSLTSDVTALVERPDDPYWVDFRDIFGDRLNLEADMTLEHDRSGGLAKLKNISFQSPQLGRLAASARLAGLAPQSLGSALSPSDLLFHIAGGRLENLEMDFQDQGLMLNLYRHLDKTVFRYAPRHQSAANIMEYYLTPLAHELEREQALANIPALLSEAQAFLNQPNRLKITANPPKPQTIMSLANMDKYDIIQKLYLTVQVNDRAPVAVAVASGVFHERLPSAPRPMEHLFEEEDI